jgi:hypothetical protein
MISEHYLQDVSFQLRDLPWRTRRELVSELEAHLAELPIGTDYRLRLGTPQQYAADMRAAAGLDPASWADRVLAGSPPSERDPDRCHADRQLELGIVFRKGSCPKQ